jgi:hypothetical protein
MTVRAFENGYWYLDQLKDFASRLGLPGARRLRKDQLEKAIVAFLETGTRAAPTKRAQTRTGVKDLERGLSLALPIENYTSRKETKDFIRRQATKLAVDVKEKSGVWYRLNRWREEQVARGTRPTYGDLVRHYVALNRVERFEKIPHGRWINFRAAFLAAEAGATHDDAREAWARLKTMDAPKTYEAWVAARQTAR